MPLIGEIAAVAAAICFSANSVLVTLAGQRLGATLVNRLVVILAAVLIFILNWLVSGQPFPTNVEPERWLLLGFSGILGFWVSFVLVIKSFLYIGPRLSLLVGSFFPVLSALLAWWLLGETLNPTSQIGIVVTVSGIIFVVSARGENGMATSRRNYWLGVALALIGSLTRALSVVASKPGLADDFPVMTGSLMRIFAGIVALGLYTVLRGEVRSSVQAVRGQSNVLRQIVLAGVLGPTAGATLMVFAVQQAEVGVASTLVNLSPIFLLPIGYVVFKERITGRAVLGTIIAFIGTAILFSG